MAGMAKFRVGTETGSIALRIANQQISLIMKIAVCGYHGYDWYLSMNIKKKILLMNVYLA